MTPERAKVIREAIRASGYWSSAKTRIAGGATPEEDAEIRAHWKTMAGSASYYDAVCALAIPVPTTPAERAGLADRIWNAKPEDYRSITAEGQRAVLCMDRDGATALWQLDRISNEDLHYIAARVLPRED